MTEKEICVPEREKEVNAEMKYLDESVANLNQTIEQLAPSLNEVLSNATSKEEDVAEPIKSLCILANDIRKIRYRVDAMEEGIREMLKRVEV